jgi:phage portal protein BeeE
MFNVSSRQFNDPQGSTYNNLEVDSENFYIKGVQPILNKIAQALTIELKKRGYPYYIYLDTSGVQALSKKRRESAEIEIKKGSEVINVLLSPLSNLQKITILTNYHGFTEDEAQEIVNNGQETTQETQENQG